MAIYKIYSEGAKLEGVITAKTFLQACHEWFDGVVGYDPKNNTYWGKKLYPSEKEAKQ